MEKKQQENPLACTIPLVWVPENHTPLDTFNLTSRVLKAFNQVGIETIDQLMNCELRALWTITGLGEKSIEEVYLCQEKFRADFLASSADDDPEQEAENRRERLNKLDEYFKRIPASRLEKPARNYVASYRNKDIAAEVLVDYERVVSIKTADKKNPEKLFITIAEIPELFETISLDNKTTNTFLLIFTLLAFDIYAPIREIFDRIYKRPKNTRCLQALQMRSEGRKLLAIAKEFDITVEGCRHLIKTAMIRISESIHNIEICGLTIDLFRFIQAELGGDDVLSTDEIYDYFSGIEHVDILLYIVQDTDFKKYIPEQVTDTFTYNKKLDIFISDGVSVTQIPSDIDDVMKRLPDIIETDKKDALLSKAAVDDHFPLKGLTIAFNRIYVPTPRLYYKKTVLKSQVYEYVLSHYFSSGIKVYNSNTTKEFCELIIELFCDSNFVENKTIMRRIITERGILCSIGRYIHPAHIKADPSLLEEICAYIEASPERSFTYKEVYLNFQEKLQLHSNIDNYFFLQGVLKYYYHERLVLTRGSIRVRPPNWKRGLNPKSAKKIPRPRKIFP
jgi:hypothetical protein